MQIFEEKKNILKYNQLFLKQKQMFCYCSKCWTITSWKLKRCTARLTSNHLRRRWETGKKNSSGTHYKINHFGTFASYFFCCKPYSDLETINSFYNFKVQSRSITSKLRSLYCLNWKSLKRYISFCAIYWVNNVFFVACKTS